MIYVTVIYVTTIFSIKAKVKSIMPPFTPNISSTSIHSFNTGTGFYKLLPSRELAEQAIYRKMLFL